MKNYAKKSALLLSSLQRGLYDGLVFKTTDRVFLFSRLCFYWTKGTP